MFDWILLWVVAAVLFLAIDMIWLMWLGRSFYTAEIGALLRPAPDLRAAGLFYVLYVTGLMVMVIWPAFQAQSALQALLYGAILGLIAYGTYDLTNLAVMKGFAARIAMIDMAWGMALTGIVSSATVGLGLTLFHR